MKFIVFNYSEAKEYKVFISLEWDLLLKLLGRTTLIFMAIILYTRLVGLRSFTKISSFDFAMTIAVGSTISSAILNDKIGLDRGLLGLLSLYFIQWFLSYMRKKFKFIDKIVDNKPILLMSDGKFLHANLRKANITEKDIYTKLRESNVLQRSQIRAVVFETTGDISVLHGEAYLEKELLKGVTS